MRAALAFIVAPLLLSSLTAHAGEATPPALDFFQPLSPTRARPAHWPARLQLRPVRGLSKARTIELLQGRWQALFHCGGAPATITYLEKWVAMPEGGRVTMTYTIEGRTYERVDTNGTTLLSKEDGTLAVTMLPDDKFELRMFGLDNGWEDSHRFVAVEGSEEWVMEIDPGSYPYAPCENGEALRGLWIKLKDPGA